MMPPTTNPPATAAPVLLTATEFLASYENARVELVKGVVKECPMPTRQHGELCGWVTYLLTRYAIQHDCGHVTSNDSWVQTRRNPDTLRGADV